MAARPHRVELRPRKGVLLLGFAASAVFVAVGSGLLGAIGWLTIAFGVATASYGAYRMLSRSSELTLTDAGIEWPRHSLRWDEVASMREGRHGLARARHLGVDTVGHAKRNRLDRVLFGVDFAISTSALDRRPEEILALVETYSGKTVRRRG